MADITDSQAIAFVNQQIRPLCEEARALKARVNAMGIDWFAGLNTVITNTSDPIDDGREAEGISRLTGAHVNSAVGNLLDAAAALNDQIVARPCVRPLEAN